MRVVALLYYSESSMFHWRENESGEIWLKGELNKQGGEIW